MGPWHRFARAVCLLVGGLAAAPAFPAEFRRLSGPPEVPPAYTGFPNKPEMVTALIEGEIVSGDAVRFKAFLETLGSERIGYLVLNSPGGLVNETIGILVELKQPFAAIVPSRTVCASACTMIFGVAAARVANSDARIGVHRGRPLPGREDFAAAADLDGEFVKLSVRLGFPGPIIDMMQTTPPNQMRWLNEADLRLWNATVLPPR